MNRTIHTLLVTIFLTLLPACSDSSEPQADFTFISASAHHHLDPQRISWSHDIRIIECLFEPLVKLPLPSDDPSSQTSGGVDPGVAESWQLSPDRLTYTFNLRKDARWSNADPVTAHDFIYAWRRAILPDLAADYTQLFFCIRGAEDFFHWRTKQLAQYAADTTQQTPQRAAELLEQALAHFQKTVGLAAPDDHTLVVTLARPTPYFLELAAFGTLMPVHQKSVEPFVTLNPDTAMLVQDPTWTKPDHLISNGPYTLAQWRFKTRLLLNANPHFWDHANTRNQSILELIVDNPQTALLKYDHHEADWLPDLPTALPIAADLVASTRNDVHTCPAAGTYFYNFNCNPNLNDGSPNPLADPRVRRALSMAIDRKTIVNRVTRLGDKQPTAHTFIPPGSLPAYDPPTNAGVTFNPKNARKLLTQAGYPDGQKLQGLSILYNTEGGHGSIAQQIKHSWETHLGVIVKLEAVESKHFSERLKKQEFTICRASWFGDYRDPTTFLDKFQSTNGNNDAAYKNPAFDQLLNQAATTPDPTQRLTTLHQAEAMMLKDQPIAPIYHYINLWLYRPNQVQNLNVNPWKTRRLEHVAIVGAR